MKRRLFSLFLVMAMVLGVLPGIAMAEETCSGVCGNDLTWTLDEQGVLTISGTGEMDTFWTSGPVNSFTDLPVLPWYEYRSDIREVVIEEGVTHISQGVFGGTHNMEKVTIADTVTSIGKSAFQQCSSLKEITLPEGIETIEDGTFSLCHSLSQVNLPDSLKRICSGAFTYCEALTHIKLPKNLERIDSYAFTNVGTCRIDFYGEAPEIGEEAFKGVTANVFYPDECESWKYVSRRQNYGGNLTWRNTTFSTPESGSVVMAGDVMGDGKLTMGDVAMLFAYVKGTNQLSKATTECADLNGDNVVNIADVAILYTQVKNTI